MCNYFPHSNFLIYVTVFFQNSGIIQLGPNTRQDGCIYQVVTKILHVEGQSRSCQLAAGQAGVGPVQSYTFSILE